MRALSVRQPWAALLVLGIKDVENRTWPTQHRGPLAIHAGLAYDDRLDANSLAALSHAAPSEAAWLAAITPRGAVIGVVDVVEVDEHVTTRNQRRRGSGPSPWAEPGLWHWHVRNARLIDPVSCRGQLGLFDVDLPETATGVPDDLIDLQSAAVHLDVNYDLLRKRVSRAGVRCHGRAARRALYSLTDLLEVAR